MQKIPLLKAETGMVLARDIVRTDNPNGPPICGKGVELTDSLIERLKRMGVPTVTVQGRPVFVAGDRSTDEILASFDSRFRKIGDDPLTGKLKKIYRNYLVKTLGE
jgi:hypothetical protein